MAVREEVEADEEGGVGEDNAACLVETALVEGSGEKEKKSGLED